MDLTPPPPARLTRRRFLTRCSLALAVAGPRHQTAAATAEPSSFFDPVIEHFMAERKIPGGALAVVQGEKIVYARGYGWANHDRQRPVTPEVLFRIASLSKPITAVAVLKLMEAGQLDLDTRPWELLELEKKLPAGRTLDARWRDITVGHLLHHTGGWDRDKSFDPMFRPRQIAADLGSPSPASAWSVIRYMLGQPLDFDPGVRYAYSNFGYCLLGRVIEAVTHERYEAHVRRAVLAPLGIDRMRIGDSRRSGPDEVQYYMPAGETARSVFADERVPWPYGAFYLEAMDAHGGWLASASGLARFAAACRNGTGLLQQRSYDVLRARPEGGPGFEKDGTPKSAYYGCGWMVRPMPGGGANYWHTGSLPGTFTLMVCRHDGISYVALFNQRSPNLNHDNELDGALYGAADHWMQ